MYDQTDQSLKKSFIRRTSTSQPKYNAFPLPTPPPVLQCNGIISDNSRSICVPINLLFVFGRFNQSSIHLFKVLVYSTGVFPSPQKKSFRSKGFAECFWHRNFPSI